MALSANTVWEVRTAGLDTNGGGFVTGASGSDYSQQDAKNSGGADGSTTDAVANGTTTITSATANFGTTIVGNIIYLQGGSGGLAAGWYEVTARASTTSITIDRNVAAGTGITMNIGGALITIGQALTNMTVAEHICYVKVGTYNLTTALATSVGGATFFNSRLTGYNTTRGDAPTGASRPTIATNGNAINALNIAHQGWVVSNFIIDGAGASRGLIGVNISALYSAIVNCKVKDFDTRGMLVPALADSIIDRCEVTACTQGIRTGGQFAIVNSVIHANTGVGIDAIASTLAYIDRCVIANNSGASSDGISGIVLGVSIRNCTIYGNGRDGIRNTNPYANLGCVIQNNLLVSNGGYGLNLSAVRSSVSYPEFAYNAFYNNTSGARNNVLAGAGDVTLTADPFTNAAGGDFSLNTTAGGGAAARAVGFPGVFPGISTTGYLDIGAAQHGDPVGGGGAPRSAGMSGGIF